MTVSIDARERRERPWLPSFLPVGAVVVGPDGEVVLVELQGRIEPLFPRRRSSVAQDPCAKRS